jgi:metal-dependent amidase/aminoacylase/carboxypeptidase family protein
MYVLRPPVTGAEDFSFFQQKVPGIFFFLGGHAKRREQHHGTIAPHARFLY